jgi:hypothetical protein
MNTAMPGDSYLDKVRRWYSAATTTILLQLLGLTNIDDHSFKPRADLEGSEDKSKASLQYAQHVQVKGLDLAIHLDRTGPSLSPDKI